MLRVQESPEFDRNSLLLTMKKLYANEDPDILYWANGTKLVEMQAPADTKKSKPKPKPKAPVETTKATFTADTEAKPSENAVTNKATVEEAIVKPKATPDKTSPTEPIPQASDSFDLPDDPTDAVPIPVHLRKKVPISTCNDGEPS